MKTQPLHRKLISYFSRFRATHWAQITSLYCNLIVITFHVVGDAFSMSCVSYLRFNYDYIKRNLRRHIKLAMEV